MFTSMSNFRLIGVLLTFRVEASKTFVTKVLWVQISSVMYQNGHRFTGQFHIYCAIGTEKVKFITWCIRLYTHITVEEKMTLVVSKNWTTSNCVILLFACCILKPILKSCYAYVKCHEHCCLFEVCVFYFFHRHNHFNGNELILLLLKPYNLKWIFIITSMHNWWINRALLIVVTAQDFKVVTYYEHWEAIRHHRKR